MVGGAAPHGKSLVTRDDHVGRAGEHRKPWAGGEEETMDGLRGRRSSGFWHPGGLEHRRTRSWGLVQRNIYAKGAVGS